jgi:hypothetical protein
MRQLKNIQANETITSQEELYIENDVPEGVRINAGRIEEISDEASMAVSVPDRGRAYR